MAPDTALTGLAARVGQVGSRMGQGARRSTVLVVDDDPVVRRVVALQVEQLGHRALQANSGRQALAFLAEQQIDVVLLDVVMPDMSGLDVLHRIKAEQRTASLPVLIMTGLADQDLRLSALGLGAEELLSKPVDRLELGARLRNILKLKYLIDQVAERSGAAGRSDQAEGHADQVDAAAWRALQRVIAMPDAKGALPKVLRLDTQGRLPAGTANATFLSDLGADVISRDRLAAAQSNLRQGILQSVKVSLTPWGACLVRLGSVSLPTGVGERQVGAIALIISAS